MCNCAKLDNTYLPPPDAQNSGGNGGNFGLAPPNQSNGGNGNGFGPQQGGFAPQQPQESQQPPIAILSYENEPNYGDGSYKYSYETGNAKHTIWRATKKQKPNKITNQETQMFP